MPIEDAGFADDVMVRHALGHSLEDNDGSPAKLRKNSPFSSEKQAGEAGYGL